MISKRFKLAHKKGQMLLAPQLLQKNVLKAFELGKMIIIIATLKCVHKTKKTKKVPANSAICSTEYATLVDACVSDG
jgi:hypothetical protein